MNYVQHSKKLANCGLIQWAVIVVIILVVITIFPIDENAASIIEKIVVWSATLAGVTITGYMGNSGIEKYADRKFALTSSTKMDTSEIEDLENQIQG